LATFASIAQSQVVIKDVPYLPDGHPRHVLDIYKATDSSNASKLIRISLLMAVTRRQSSWVGTRQEPNSLHSCASTIDT
jgi:hypothetical protein